MANNSITPFMCHSPMLITGLLSLTFYKRDIYVFYESMQTPHKCYIFQLYLIHFPIQPFILKKEFSLV